MAGGRHEKLKITRDDLVVGLKIDETGWTLKEASPIPWQAATINDAPIITGPSDRCFCPRHTPVSALQTTACRILVGTASLPWSWLEIKLGRLVCAE